MLEYLELHKNCFWNVNEVKKTVKCDRIVKIVELVMLYTTAASIQASTTLYSPLFWRMSSILILDLLLHFTIPEIALEHADTLQQWTMNIRESDRNIKESKGQQLCLLDFCEAQGKGRVKGRPRKVTQRSFIDGGWWMVDILSLMLYTKFGCHLPSTYTSLNLQH